MITELYQAIGSGLKTIKDCPVYLDDVPQGFNQPSFLISFYQQDNSRGINGRLKNDVSIDVMYFPYDGPDKAEECLSVGESMNREFLAPGFKIKNRNQRIEDNVLHYMFDVGYREYRSEDVEQMHEMSQNTKLKED